MRSGITEFQDGLGGQLVFEPEMPLLHHRRSYVSIDSIEQRIVRVRKRVGREALSPEVRNHLAGIARLESNGAVARIVRIGIGRNRATTR